MGVTPAYAQVQLTITKTHTGTFTQGGQGVYHIVVTNAGDEPTSESGTEMTDILPEGSPPSPRSWSLHLPCSKGLSRHRSQEADCLSGVLEPGDSYSADITVAVAANAPCAITNTASVIGRGSLAGATVSDPTEITGPDCNGGGDGGGPVLPVTLNGVIPMFNNITTNSNINSPGAANVSNQASR